MADLLLRRGSRVCGTVAMLPRRINAAIGVSALAFPARDHQIFSSTSLTNPNGNYALDVLAQLLR